MSPRLRRFAVTAACCALCGVSAVAAGSASAESTTVPAEYVSAAKSSALECDQEVVDATLVVTQVRSASKFDAQAVSAAGAQGPAQLMPSTFAVYGADDDGSGVASPFDVVDAVAALTRLDCSIARELGARGHAVDPVSVIAAVEGGLDQVDHPTARDIADRVWANRVVVK